VLLFFINPFMRYIILPAIVLLTAFMPQKKKRVIFFGDSITQQGAEPGGYINRIDSMCRFENKSLEYEFLGAGIGGNKVYDLYLRMDSDVLTKSPDIVVIYIGVNDVWHKVSSGTGTDPDKFEKFYNAIIKKLQQRKRIWATHQNDLLQPGKHLLVPTIGLNPTPGGKAV